MSQVALLLIRSLHYQYSNKQLTNSLQYSQIQFDLSINTNIIFRFCNQLFIIMDQQLQHGGTFRVQAKQISPKIQKLLHSHLKRNSNHQFYFQYAEYSLCLQNNTHLIINFYAPQFNSLQHSMQFKGVQSLNHVNVYLQQNMRKILIFREGCFQFYSTSDIQKERSNILHCEHKQYVQLEANQRIVHISKDFQTKARNLQVQIGIHLFITNLGRIYYLKISHKKAQVVSLNPNNKLLQYFNKFTNFMGHSVKQEAHFYDSHLMKIDQASCQTFNSIVLKDWTICFYFISIPMDKILPNISQIKWQIDLANKIKRQYPSFEQSKSKIIQSKMISISQNEVGMALLVKTQQKQIIYSLTIDIRQQKVESLQKQQFMISKKINFHIIQNFKDNLKFSLLVKFQNLTKGDVYIMLQSYSLKDLKLEHHKQIKQKLSEQSQIVLSQGEIILATSLRMLVINFQQQIPGQELQDVELSQNLLVGLKMIVDDKQNHILRSMDQRHFQNLYDLLEVKRQKIVDKLKKLKVQLYEKHNQQQKIELGQDIQRSLDKVVETYIVINLLQTQITSLIQGYKDQKFNTRYFFNQHSMKQLVQKLQIGLYLQHFNNLKSFKQVYRKVMKTVIRLLEPSQTQNQTQRFVQQDPFFLEQHILERIIIQHFTEFFQQEIKQLLNNQESLQQNQQLNYYPELDKIQLYNGQNIYGDKEQQFFVEDQNAENERIYMQYQNYASQISVKKDEQAKQKFIKKFINWFPFQRATYRMYIRSYHQKKDFSHLLNVAQDRLNDNLFLVLFFQSNFVSIQELCRYYDKHNQISNSQCLKFLQNFINQYLKTFKNRIGKKVIPFGSIIQIFCHHHEEIYMFLKDRQPVLAVLVGLMLGKRSQIQTQIKETATSLRNPNSVQILLKACQTNQEIVKQELTAQICKSLSKPEFIRSQLFLKKVEQSQFQKQNIPKRQWEQLKSHLKEADQIDIGRLQKKVKLVAQ